MGAARQLHVDLLVRHADPSRGVEESSEDLSSLRFVVAPEGFGKLPIDTTGDYGQQHVKIDIQGDRGGEGVEVEEIHGIRQTVFDEHASGVTRDEGLERGGHVVGEEDGRLIVAEIPDQELADRAFVAFQGHSLVDDAGSLELSMRDIQTNRFPSGARHRRYFGDQLGGSASEGEEGDAHFIELGQIGVGGELGVKNEMGRAFAITFLPKPHESKHFIGLFALAEVGVGVAEDLSLCVLGEERENGGAFLTAAGHVVFLHKGVFAEVGNRMEVEVEGAGIDELLIAQAFDPTLHQARDGLASQSGGILRHKGGFGDRV